jgi:hypothetical protein
VPVPAFNPPAAIVTELISNKSWLPLGPDVVSVESIAKS